jgi:toxin YhaV
LRTRGAKTDAYAVFRDMLENGNPPDDWAGLVKAASDRAAIERLAAAQDN